MRVAIMIEGQEGLTWERWFRLARAAEDLGYDALCRSDHLTGLSGEPKRPSLETWVSLAWLASHTQRIRFGPMVSPMTFYHPALLAKMATAIDVLSGGRLDLGIGAGWNEYEHAMFGDPVPAGEGAHGPARVRRAGDPRPRRRAAGDALPGRITRSGARRAIRCRRTAGSASWWAGGARSARSGSPRNSRTSGTSPAWTSTATGPSAACSPSTARRWGAIPRPSRARS